MSIVSPSVVSQNRRFRFSGHRHVILSVSIKGSTKPVKVGLRIFDDDKKVLAGFSEVVECDVAPSEVCSGLFDRINASKTSKIGLLNDDSVLTDLLTDVAGTAKAGDPDPARTPMSDDDVDWEAVRDRLCQLLPGQEGALKGKLQEIEDAEAAFDKETAQKKKEMAEQKEALKARLKEQRAVAPKGSKAESGASAHSSQQTAASSTPQKSTKNGLKK